LCLEVNGLFTGRNQFHGSRDDTLLQTSSNMPLVSFPVEVFCWLG
jgi:hypothetical protein